MRIQLSTTFLMALWSVWIVLAMTHAAWPRNAALKALSVVRRLLLAGSFVVFVVIAYVSLPWSSMIASVRARTPQATATAKEDFGSCAAVEFGMTKEQVLARAGKPDAVENAEDVRGTGAVCWRYGAHCAVYLVGDVVQYVE